MRKNAPKIGVWFLIFFVWIVMGFGYGHVSARMNIPASRPGDDGQSRPVEWEPSAVWLPSYMLYQFHVCVFGDKRGWLPLDGDDESRYERASQIVGGGMALIVAGIALVVRRLYNKAIQS